jgi:hypothetical protein
MAPILVILGPSALELDVAVSSLEHEAVASAPTTAMPTPTFDSWIHRGSLLYLVATNNNLDTTKSGGQGG